MSFRNAGSCPSAQRQITDKKPPYNTAPNHKQETTPRPEKKKPNTHNNHCPRPGKRARVRAPVSELTAAAHLAKVADHVDCVLFGRRPAAVCDDADEAARRVGNEVYLLLPLALQQVRQQLRRAVDLCDRKTRIC
eukprot:3098501-Rhodomonas_salina.1